MKLIQENFPSHEILWNNEMLFSYMLIYVTDIDAMS